MVRKAALTSPNSDCSRKIIYLWTNYSYQFHQWNKLYKIKIVHIKCTGKKRIKIKSPKCLKYKFASNIFLSQKQKLTPLAVLYNRCKKRGKEAAGKIYLIFHYFFMMSAIKYCIISYYLTFPCFRETFHKQMQWFSSIRTC